MERVIYSHNRRGTRNEVPKHAVKDWSHPLTRPLYSINTKNSTIFVRHETMLRIPFFVERMNNGEIVSGGEYGMFGPLDHSPSMCLLFDLAERDKTLDMTEVPEYAPSVDLFTAEDFLRAYALAGHWGMEKIQNWIVDRLIAHYLVHAVPSKDIGMLIQLGLMHSTLCQMLMQELACSLLDGENLVSPDNKNEEFGNISEVISEAKHMAGEDDSTSNNEGKAAKPSLSELNEAEKEHDEEYVRNARQQLRPHAVEQTTSPTSATQSNTISKSANMVSNSSNSSQYQGTGTNSSGIWNQIQRTWSINACTNLMAMMIDVHQQDRSPTDRSPLELAASDPCKCHVHTGSGTCCPPKKKVHQGKKRIRDTLEPDTSSENDDDVTQYEDEENKENVDAADNKEKNAPQWGTHEKKRRMWGLFAR